MPGPAVCDNAAHADLAGGFTLPASLDPLELLHRIRAAQTAVAALALGELSHGPERQSLDPFRTELPQLWRDGEARPTHRQWPRQARTWRTRKDPFEGAWPAAASICWCSSTSKLSTSRAFIRALGWELSGQSSGWLSHPASGVRCCQPR